MPQLEYRFRFRYGLKFKRFFLISLRLPRNQVNILSELKLSVYVQKRQVVAHNSKWPHDAHKPKVVAHSIKVDLHALNTGAHICQGAWSHMGVRKIQVVIVTLLDLT